MTTLCSPWIDRNDLAACNCPDATGPVTDLSIEVASEVLYALTGRQYPGTCEAVLRPCGTSASSVPTGWSYPWFPMRQGGVWLNTGGCGCHVARDCACSSYPRVDLGRSDVQSIEAVTIGAVVLDPATYRLDEGSGLVRLDAGWPCCQDLGRDLGEEGTWSIELTYGFPVPEALKRAAAILAVEYVKACIDDETCRLPAQTQSLSRQGVTLELVDPAGGGALSIPEVKDIVTAFNPHGIARAALVRSPEVRSAGLWS